MRRLFCKRRTRSGADLIKKLLRAPQDVLELRQLQEVLLQRLLVGVDFLQLVLQLLECGLEEQSGEGSARARSNQQSYGDGRGHLHVDHVPGEGDLGVLSCVHHRDVGLFDLFFHEPCEGGRPGSANT